MVVARKGSPAIDTYYYDYLTPAYLLVSRPTSARLRPKQEQLAAQDIRATGPLVWHPGVACERQSLPEGQPPTACPMWNGANNTGLDRPE